MLTRPVRVLRLLLAAYLIVWLACTPASERVNGNKFSLRRVAIDPAGGGDAAISPDGNRIVLSSRRTGNWDLWIYEISSQEWSQVTSHPGDDFEAQWSPDGSRMAFTSTRNGNKDVWTIALADRTLTQITETEHEEEEYPAWAPDGESIVFTAGPWKKRHFYRVSAGGGVPQVLTSSASHLGACSFTPDGRSLVYHAYDSGSGNVFLLPLQEREPVPLTRSAGTDYKPTVSPDGAWVAFSRSDEGPSTIRLMSLAGNRSEAALPTRHDDRWPTWTASGDRLLFHRLVQEGAAIRILDRAQGNVETVVDSTEKPGQASFDPQARRIVYSAEAQERRVLRVRDLESGVVQMLNTGSGDASYPRWSPDGRSIAFASRPKDRWEICTIRVNEEQVRCWTESYTDLRGMHGPLDWSPDNSKIVFKADMQAFESDIFSLDVNTGILARLTADSWFDEAPSWTPDGRGVLFMSTRGGNWTWGLFAFSLEKGAVEVVAEPDYVEKNFPRAGGAGTIWSMRDEKGTEYVAEKTPDGTLRILEAAGPGARWPSYSSDGRFVLFTVVSERVEYWIADNLFSEGSPLLLPQPFESTAVTRTRNGLFAAARGGWDPLTWRSPVKLHER